MSVCSEQFIGSKPEKLTKKLRTNIEKKSAQFATQGLRVLAVASREVDPKEIKDLESIDEVEKDLVFVGLIGIMGTHSPKLCLTSLFSTRSLSSNSSGNPNPNLDPPRAEAKAAVAQCHRAGIHVCMITGDHHFTAKAIGVALGTPSLPSLKLSVSLFMLSVS